MKKIIGVLMIIIAMALAVIPGVIDCVITYEWLVAGVIILFIGIVAGLLIGGMYLLYSELG